MKRRLNFSCWNCERHFSLLVEIDEYPDILSECPYCDEDVLIKLSIYPNETTQVFREGPDAEREQRADDPFPAIIPTRRPDEKASK